MNTLRKGSCSPWPGLLFALALLSGCSSSPSRQVPAPLTPSPPTAATLALVHAPATATPAQAAPAKPSPAVALPTAPSPTGALPALAIQSFTARIEDAAAGKRLTFQWATTGAATVRIVSGASVRFASQWTVPPTGTQSVEFADTYYANPAMTLIAADGAGHEATKSINVAWPCRYAYFFAPAPALCPSVGPTTMQAAEQRFENGRMVWLKELHYRSQTAAGVILVLYDDGHWARFDDTWKEGDPEVDPAITAPAGKLQPARGFGKVWREHADVRTRLGWASAPEQGFTSTWQPQMRESLPNVEYVRTLDGRVVEYTGMTDGGWQVTAP